MCGKPRAHGLCVAAKLITFLKAFVKRRGLIWSFIVHRDTLKSVLCLHSAGSYVYVKGLTFNTKPLFNHLLLFAINWEVLISGWIWCISGKNAQLMWGQKRTVGIVSLRHLSVGRLSVVQHTFPVGHFLVQNLQSTMNTLTPKLTPKYPPPPPPPPENSKIADLDSVLKVRFPEYPPPPPPKFKNSRFGLSVES